MMANSRSKNTKKKKTISTNLLVAIILLAVGVILATVAVALLAGSKPDPDTSIPEKESSETFAESSIPPVSEPEESSEPVSEFSEIEVSEESIPTYEYEYVTDITDFLAYIEPEDPLEYVFLVNPTHTLASDFVPDDLIDVVYTRKDGRDTQKMRLSAEKALEAFLNEGKATGDVTNVTVTSAYRSYSYQNYLFNMYCEQHQSKFKTREECEAYVLTFSTKPGTSEHQSGLCCDMHNLGSAEQSFAKTSEAKWLAENCYKFGFILRYPADKEDITKIIYEPWHFRFVGRFAATEMHELGMCLEEYIQYKGLE